tara:strand:- start:171 stop:653 length:483 start_codon:yes stop_codon:yes gene_type:complete
MISELSKFGTILQQGVILGEVPWVTLGLKVPDGPYQAIRVHVPRNWIERVPVVECAGVPFWLKSGADWHAEAKTGYLCFDYGRMWVDHLSAREKEEGVTADLLAKIAAEWLVTATGFLLHVHFRCHQTGRKEWPSTVEFWEHDDVSAKRQLEQITRRRVL